MSDRDQAPGLVSQNGVYAPLATIDPQSPLLGGYGWLDGTDFVGGVPQTLHPGADLNAGSAGDADCGLAVVAIVSGVVRAILRWDGYTPGEGNHLWIELTSPVAAAPAWSHYDHLQAFAPGLHEGQEVAAGEVVGCCGESGGWQYCHTHTELTKGPPASWWMWPYGWSRGQVEATYWRPYDWFRATVAKAGQAPPQVIDMILSGAQAAAVQAVVWAEYWQPEAAEFAIPSAWRSEWRRGVWRGAPLSSEQLVPEDPAEGKPAGSWQLFQGGAAVWLPGQDVSWNG
jgi:hypothetical protein